MNFPQKRMRRLRSSKMIRDMVNETRVDPNQLIYPLFVCPGQGVKKEIPSMPGQYQHSIDMLIEECRNAKSDGISAVLLFGIPEKKDAMGSEGYSDNGIIQKAIRALRREVTDLFIVTDVCNCEYTDHGHCGPVKKGKVDNDETLKLLSKQALSHAKVGADMVAPSDMMDGRVQHIRKALDENGYCEIPIMSYAAKFASAFYGPFREAAGSAPQFGDRKAYQMNPANVREAIAEVILDVEEGADIVMVKPALSYMDIIREVKDAVLCPVACYNVSGEYAMVKAAAKNGWIDEKKIVMEMATSFKRAGADIIITYFARDIAKYVREGS